MIAKVTSYKLHASPAFALLQFSTPERQEKNNKLAQIARAICNKSPIDSRFEKACLNRAIASIFARNSSAIANQDLLTYKNGLVQFKKDHPNTPSVLNAFFSDYLKNSAPDPTIVSIARNWAKYEPRYSGKSSFVSRVGMGVGFGILYGGFWGAVSTHKLGGTLIGAAIGAGVFGCIGLATEYSYYSDYSKSQSLEGIEKKYQSQVKSLSQELFDNDVSAGEDI
jgi:hypothetical protein